MLVYATQLQDIKCGAIITMASPDITWPNFIFICSDAQLVYGEF